MFQIGDKVVHPMHGAGIIESVVEKSISGVSREYYILKLAANDMLMMVPLTTCGDIGVRPVIDADQADEVIAAFDSIEVEDDLNWNRRYRENMVLLKSGDLMQVACVLKGLVLRDREKGLSNGERKMLSVAKQILISELVLVTARTFDEIDRKISHAII